MKRNETESFSRAQSAALHFLSYRARSKAEVRSQLLRRFPSSLVEQVLSVLSERSLIDDVEFARQWRESRNSTNPRSAWVIKRELLAKGVDKDVATQAVEYIDDEESAYRAGRKMAARLEDADLGIFRRKVFGYLHRRGFADLLCRRIIRRLWEERTGEGREYGQST